MTIPEGMRLYKVVGPEGQSIHGGDLTWSLPSGDEPGEWHKVAGHIAACERGLHLTPKPFDFWQPNSRVFEAECRGRIDDSFLLASQSPKLAASEARLLREVSWGKFSVWLNGEHELSSGEAVASGSASVRASGSASVRASDSASVMASGSASVTASGSASVRAYDSASVRASGSASVRAYDSASVTASGSASVRASGSASVMASGSASVRAYGSASVTAYDSASVTAYDSASVESTIYHRADATVALEHMAVHIDRRNGKLMLRGARGGQHEVPQP